MYPLKWLECQYEYEHRSSGRGLRIHGEACLLGFPAIRANQLKLGGIIPHLKLNQRSSAHYGVDNMDNQLTIEGSPRNQEFSDQFAHTVAFIARVSPSILHTTMQVRGNTSKAVISGTLDDLVRVLALHNRAHEDEFVRIQFSW